MRYIIGAILVLIALIIFGLIWRKRVYDEVDRLESWKMDIMNRSVTEELSKVKSLNLSGETQEKFEAWRDRWDQILTKELPNLEEDLFDVEEAADRYQFRRVKKALSHTEQKLIAVEKDIEAMFEELEVLLDSEKSSRIEIEAIEPELTELSKTLVQNRHQYGKAARIFESRIQEQQKKLKEYERLTAQGDYLEAKTLVQSLREELQELLEESRLFPERYKKVSAKLPEQINELISGMEEMENEGYRITHLDYKSELHTFQEQLEESLTQLDQGDQENIELVIKEIESRIHDMYQQLEREAIAHNFVEQQHSSYQSQIDELTQMLTATDQEMEDLQRTYQLEDEDLETHRTLDHWLGQLKKKYLSFENKLQDGTTAYSELRAELERMKQQVEELQEKHQAFSERIQMLRKDEVEAKNRIHEAEQLLIDTHRRLKRSNLPGIPSHIFEEMKETTVFVDEVFQSLEEQPLDMTKVHEKLEAAMAASEKLHEDAKVVLDQAFLAERLIQYGNRYRSQYPMLAASLVEAENDFRNYDYESAVDRAAGAIKEVDPEALKRIESDEQVLV
ncbi:septation ring formation regulator EzrA [Halobacillus salinarum]|uniref:Septation ring formation regulator EzrA n=1 Tax=Halobacillus salinarum TaxID=2932257 RepID=A0ABY4EP30_9BACI|nr:septation ring formation regulator EzrA [Halobacillus salinarum]UOQ46140.1 septation ring formation regulator EzrA [Halobacillus salinarum]